MGVNVLYAPNVGVLDLLIRMMMIMSYVFKTWEFIPHVLIILPFQDVVVNILPF